MRLSAVYDLNDSANGIKQPSTIEARGTFTTNSSGAITVYLTDDKTVNGNPIFSDIHKVIIDSISSSNTGGINTPFAARPSITDGKTLIIVVAKGTSNLLGLTSSAVAAVGVTVSITVYGN